MASQANSPGPVADRTARSTHTSWTSTASCRWPKPGSCVTKKMCWQLAVVDAEQAALTQALAACPNAPVKVGRRVSAAVRLRRRCPRSPTSDRHSQVWRPASAEGAATRVHWLRSASRWLSAVRPPRRPATGRPAALGRASVPVPCCPGSPDGPPPRRGTRRADPGQWPFPPRRGGPRSPAPWLSPSVKRSPW
ncbi:hypothetical protein STAFG_0419 [Streptomyces afghaniensis 772]|uniref:Uncharacterized protein n=1 Tax=Streptomyces afghaniensis 772 TaxID=1283301 RepID=S4MSL6_9ACTN|nr:hypothetical protein STAFG_0419 [Streptomyces afghaniensis 772]